MCTDRGNMRRAQSRQTRTGGDERSARGRMRARSTPGRVSGLSVSPADPAISWFPGFCGVARSAGEAVKTSNVGRWNSSNFKKVARGRPADGTPWPFCFQVDTRGQGFLWGWRYVVGMKGQKWAEGWLPASGSVWKVHRPILRSVRNMAIRPGGSKNGSAFVGSYVAATRNSPCRRPFFQVMNVGFLRTIRLMSEKNESRLYSLTGASPGCPD